MNILKHTAYIGLSALVCAGISSCKNGNQDFPDYEGGIGCYFAYQYPVRTITLGEDPQQDNNLDNEHKFVINATQSGGYNGAGLRVHVQVDPSLVNNLTFENGQPVKAMPEAYYSLASTTLTSTTNSMLYGTQVSLTDAFFNDPAAISNTYVIPLVITQAEGADFVITGTPLEGVSAVRQNAADWEVLPKDYVLYCVKFINPWHASYLRRGVDKFSDGSTVVRHAKYIEYNDITKVYTNGMNSCIFPVTKVLTDADGNTTGTLTCDLLLTFNGNDCTISSNTAGMTASGTGKFVIDGDKLAYDNEDQNALYLNYEIDFGTIKQTTTDTLTVTSRDVVMETFSPIYNN